jgi:hypothetical protein
MGTDTRDLYQRFELEVRTPKKRILLDAFLPDPGTLPSVVAAPVPPPLPEMPPEEAHFFRRQDEEADEPPPPPKPKKKAKAAPAKRQTAPMSLQDEIAEFMNRGQSAYAPDDNLDGVTGSKPAAPADPAPAEGKPGPADDDTGSKSGSS